MIIRLATDTDIPDIVRLRREAAEWLSSLGSDQWSNGIDEDEFTRRVQESIHSNETWVAVDNDQVLGTIAIDSHTNPGLWSSEEMQNSLIIHRMIKTRGAPEGLGADLLHHAEHVATQNGAHWLRLDAWTTNIALHEYYRRAGFEHVRTIEGHHTQSAALFARRV